MKIKMWDAVREKDILKGDFSYLEEYGLGNKPSFFISLFPGNKEIYFYCESKEELNKLIESLTRIKEKK